MRQSPARLDRVWDFAALGLNFTGLSVVEAPQLTLQGQLAALGVSPSAVGAPGGAPRGCGTVLPISLNVAKGPQAALGDARLLQGMRSAHCPMPLQPAALL